MDKIGEQWTLDKAQRHQKEIDDQVEALRRKLVICGIPEIEDPEGSLVCLYIWDASVSGMPICLGCRARKSGIRVEFDMDAVFAVFIGAGSLGITFNRKFEGGPIIINAIREGELAAQQ